MPPLIQCLIRLFQAAGAEGPASADSTGAGLQLTLLPLCSIYNVIVAGVSSLALVLLLIAAFGGDTKSPAIRTRRLGDDQPNTTGAASTTSRHSNDTVVKVQRRDRN